MPGGAALRLARAMLLPAIGASGVAPASQPRFARQQISSRDGDHYWPANSSLRHPFLPDFRGALVVRNSWPCLRVPPFVVLDDLPIAVLGRGRQHSCAVRLDVLVSAAVRRT